MMNFLNWANNERNKFIVSSGIIFAGSTFANLVNYLYNLILGRMFDPVSYGEVAAFVTLAMIVIVPAGTLSTLVAKYVSEFAAAGEIKKVKAVYASSVVWALSAGFLLLVAFLVASPFLASYLKTSVTPTFVFAFFLPLSLIAASSKGTIQGLHNFFSTAVFNVIEAVSKLLFAVLFVAIGWGVAGAVGGILAGAVLSYLYGLLVLRNKLPPTNDTNEGPALFKVPNYIYVIFLATLCLSVFGNIDVVLAKHYLSEYDAGQYAAMAVLGRIVTYASIAMITVLLPMVSAAGKDPKKAQKLLGMSLLLTTVISAIIIIFFYLFPQQAIMFLFGRDYLAVAPFLGLFGMIMLLGSLSKIFVNYFMARHQTSFVRVFMAVTLTQVILIMFFHKDISQIINNLLATNILLLVGLVVVYASSRGKDLVEASNGDNGQWLN